MAAGSTYTPIATTTLGSAQTTVTFNSFSGYTDLVLVATQYTTSGAYDLCVQFNGDTGNNYSMTSLSGNGSAASSARISNNSRIFLDYEGVVNGTINTKIVQIMNYSNATTYKTVLSRAVNAATGTDAIVGLWRSTAAITSFVLNLQTGGTFAAGSTFTLYGIAAA